MGFREELQRAVANVRARENKLQSQLADDVFHSIRDGSHITGAPGQPVASGELYKSYRKRKVGRREWLIESNAPHAVIIEENRRGATLRSKVGGFHSIKLTRLGWRRLVAFRVAHLSSGAGVPTITQGARARDRRGRFTWTKKARVTLRGG